MNFAVADPGFPVGGWDTDLQCECFLVKMCAKMKELGPVGGHTPLHDPPMIWIPLVILTDLWPLSDVWRKTRCECSDVNYSESA